jgi:hypothetical protein
VGFGREGEGRLEGAGYPLYTASDNSCVGYLNPTETVAFEVDHNNNYGVVLYRERK